jgi:hypothetical protein
MTEKFPKYEGEPLEGNVYISTDWIVEAFRLRVSDLACRLYVLGELRRQAGETEFTITESAEFLETNPDAIVAAFAELEAMEVK